MSEQEPLIGPEDDPLIGLQGRIIALELIMRDLLALEAMKEADPVSSLRGTKSALHASLQTMGRPYDETSGAIWSEAVAALDRLFEETELRVKGRLE